MRQTFVDFVLVVITIAAILGVIHRLASHV